MEKRFCDGPGCGKEIDESIGFYTVQGQYKERDYGITLPSEGVDFCSLRCLIAWAKESRRSRVVKERRTEMGEKSKILYRWEGENVSFEDIEEKKGKNWLTQEAYERLK